MKTINKKYAFLSTEEKVIIAALKCDPSDIEKPIFGIGHPTFKCGNKYLT
jgi:hypothetical protein